MGEEEANKGGEEEDGERRRRREGRRRERKEQKKVDKSKTEGEGGQDRWKERKKIRNEKVDERKEETTEWKTDGKKGRSAGCALKDNWADFGPFALLTIVGAFPSRGRSEQIIGPNDPAV